VQGKGEGEADLRPEASEMVEEAILAVYGDGQGWHLLGARRPEAFVRSKPAHAQLSWAVKVLSDQRKALGLPPRGAAAEVTRLGVERACGRRLRNWLGASAAGPARRWKKWTKSKTKGQQKQARFWNDQGTARMALDPVVRAAEQAATHGREHQGRLGGLQPVQGEGAAPEGEKEEEATRAESQVGWRYRAAGEALRMTGAEGGWQVAVSVQDACEVEGTAWLQVALELAENPTPISVWVEDAEEEEGGLTWALWKTEAEFVALHRDATTGVEGTVGWKMAAVYWEEQGRLERVAAEEAWQGLGGLGAQLEGTGGVTKDGGTGPTAEPGRETWEAALECEEQEYGVVRGRGQLVGQARQQEGAEGKEQWAMLCEYAKAHEAAQAELRLQDEEEMDWGMREEGVVLQGKREAWQRLEEKSGGHAGDAEGAGGQGRAQARRGTEGLRSAQAKSCEQARRGPRKKTWEGRAEEGNGELPVATIRRKDNADEKTLRGEVRWDKG
jgi:hypothetical protein